MYTKDLPAVLVDLCCKFAFDATRKQTMYSVDTILELKRHDIHPLMLASMVGDYTLCRDVWHYDRETLSASIMGPYCPVRRVVPTPFVEVHSVWFAYGDLFNYFAIQQVLFDIDWRCVKHLVRSIGYRNREAFSKWVCSSSDGIVFCSSFFKALSFEWLKKQPTELSRYIATQNNHLYAGGLPAL